MAEEFAERKLIGSEEKEQLVQRSYNYLEAALGKGSNSKMSYRGRAAAVMLNAVRDLALHISETDIARAAGFNKKSMTTNANVIAARSQVQK